MENKIDLTNYGNLLTQMPLYTKIKIESELYNLATKFLVSTKYSFKCYCLECKQESVFNKEKIIYDRAPAVIMGSPSNYQIYDGTYTFISSCALNNRHKLYADFIYKNTILIKIGQYPSIPDLSFPEIQKYSKILSTDELFEFKRGIGLISYDIGIGSFIYLRRIFENFVYKAAKNHEDKLKTQIEKKKFRENFNSIKFLNKIELVKDFLPDILFNNKEVYQIISKGVHELSEKECLESFDVVKNTIELILDEELHRKEQEEKKKKVTGSVQNLHAKLKSGKGK